MDVSLCSKLCEQFFVTQNYGIVDKINELSDENRLRCLRNKSRDKIYSILSGYFQDLKEDFGMYDSIENSSISNRDYADIVIMSNGKRYDCELKFGAETNSNIGLESFKNLFPFDFSIPIEVRNDWFNKIYLQNQKTEYDWLCYKLGYYNKLINDFNSIYGNIKLSGSQIDYLGKIINSSGSTNSNCVNYVKYVLKRNHLVRKNAVPMSGNWKVLIVPDLLNIYKSRVNISLTNNEYNVKFILNWKNTYERNGVRIKAKYGFGTPSFNVFITNANGKRKTI